MKFELINKNKFKCTITQKDLSDRNMRLNDLAYGSEQSRSLFREIMQGAGRELNFDTENMPVMIEAIPMADGSLQLVISREEYPDQLDARFSDFSEGFEDYSLEGVTNALAGRAADDILDFFRNIQDSEDPDDAPITVDNGFSRTYSFIKLADLTALSKVLEAFYDGDNSLYYDPEEKAYYLVFRKGETSPEMFNRVCNISAEYAVSDRFSDSFMGYLSERCILVSAHEGVQTLAQY